MLLGMIYLNMITNNNMAILESRHMVLDIINVPVKSYVDV